jgi:hypothetical protein
VEPHGRQPRCEPGAARILPKPFSASGLLNVVTDVLSEDQ